MKSVVTPAQAGVHVGRQASGFPQPWRLSRSFSENSGSSPTG
jgi:hypothetical protein